MYLKRLLICTLIASSIAAFAQAAQKDNKSTSTHPTKKPAAAAHGSAQTAPLPSDAGERIFEQRCSRCHNAPEGFSPRISGTIVRHMRVRAALSQQQEEDLLRFFNP